MIVLLIKGEKGVWCLEKVVAVFFRLIKLFVVCSLFDHKIVKSMPKALRLA
jgi:hypothetical protein